TPHALQARRTTHHEAPTPADTLIAAPIRGASRQLIGHTSGIEPRRPASAGAQTIAVSGNFVQLAAFLTRRPHRRCPCALPFEIPAQRHLSAVPSPCVAAFVTNVCPIEQPVRPTRPNKKPPHLRGFLESGRPDLNRGPHRPERCALPGCATPR